MIACHMALRNLISHDSFRDKWPVVMLTKDQSLDFFIGISNRERYASQGSVSLVAARGFPPSWFIVASLTAMAEAERLKFHLERKCSSGGGALLRATCSSLVATPLRKCSAVRCVARRAESPRGEGSRPHGTSLPLHAKQKQKFKNKIQNPEETTLKNSECHF